MWARNRDSGESSVVIAVVLSGIILPIETINYSTVLTNSLAVSTLEKAQFATFIANNDRSGDGKESAERFGF